MDKNITKEELLAFFEDRCGGGDAERIARYLQEHPEVVGEFLPEEEWMQFQTTADLPGGWSEKWWKNIRARRITVYKSKVSWPFIRVAAAVLVVAGGFLLLGRRSKKMPEPALAETFLGEHRDTPGRGDSFTRGDTIWSNGTRRIQVAVLDDGSVVELSPASNLQFKMGFEHDQRTIRLTGEALFKVAKDQRRPFTVFAGGFSTTALGTIFRVKAYGGSKTSGIQLLQGKVAVRSLNHPTSTEYLLPGQECTFDLAKNILRKSILRAAPGPDLSLLTDASYVETASEITFKNLSLPKVLVILSNAYHKPIRFVYRDLSKRKFTGSVDKAQPLETTLNNLSSLNDLLVSQQDSSFRVTLRK